MKKLAVTTLSCLALAGCVSSQRPEFTSIQQSLDTGAQQAVVQTPVVIPQAEKSAAGSLWKPGSKQFFKDQRASQVGDILTVIVSEQSSAETEANTETERTSNSESGFTSLLNLEDRLAQRGFAPGTNTLLNVDSDREFEGEGSTDRSDTVSANIAAVVVQVLPNGNLVIQGRREVVVNYEMQELMVQGIVRPEDITPQNTVSSQKVAEARIFYAGRGLIDESQRPQYGVRFIDKITPF